MPGQPTHPGALRRSLQPKATLNKFLRWRAPGCGMGCEAQTAAMARAMAVVCALPARPMTTRPGAPNCRI
jgi:hypothetical protein